jgi:excisionase family DNA binding protein
MEKGFLNIDEASTYLNVKKSFLYSLVEGATIPYFRLNRLIRFRKDDLDRWMENHRQDPSEPNKRARAILKATNSDTIDIDRVMKKTIAEAKGKCYPPNHGRPDQDKDLRKEVSSGTL